MLYVQSRKSFKVRREKKLISLPSAKKTLGKELVCRVSEGLHSANPLALGKLTISGSVLNLYLNF